MYLNLLLLSLVVFAIVVVVFARSRFASIFHPISLYLMFHGLVFVIRPFFAYFHKYEKLYRSYDFVPSPATKAIVIVCANLGMLAFVMGAWRSGPVPLAFPRQSAARDRRRLLVPFLWVVASLAPIAVASLVTALNPAPGGMRLDMHSGVVININQNGWFIEAQLMLVPLSVMLAWLLRFRWWSLIPLVVFVFLRAGTGGRGPFVIACIAAALLWLYDRGRRVPSGRMIMVLIPLVGAFYAVGQDRGATVRTLLENGTLIEFHEKRGFMEGMDFANMEFFEYLVETVPEKTRTYGYFVDNLQVFTEPVPRVLWKNKPIGPPIKLFNLFDYGFPIGLTYSLPGYGWMQAGFAGVIIWCGLWGLALGAVYARFVREERNNFAVAFYFTFLPIFVIAFRDGLLITILRTGVFYVTPVIAWYLLARWMGVDDRQQQPLSAPGGVRVERSAARRSRDLPDPGEVVPRAWRQRSTVRAAE